MAFFNSMSDLDIGGGNEDMHHTYIGIKAGLGIFLDYARKAADLGIKTRSCDLPDAVELALR
jgi:hypothetical protein